MASTAPGQLLTETHRLAQVRIGDATKQQMAGVWPVLDLQSLDASFAGWLDAVNQVVGPARALSAQTAGAYFTTFRHLEAGQAKPFRPELADPVDPETLKISMRVTGPVAVKTGIGNGSDLADAAANAFTMSAGAAVRHALAGGRETISESVAADPKALGWARVASGSACAFCAMLASRGPVYSENAVDFEAHDHCTCSAEPFYSTDQAWPSNSDDYRDLYNQATAGVVDGGDLLNAFRQALQG